MQHKQTAPKATAEGANSAGLGALKDGNLDEAVRAFTLATELDPNSVALWSNLAHAHRLAGNNAEEGVALDRALALNRLDFGSQLRKAQLLQRTGQETEALIAWNGVQQLAAQQGLEFPPAVQAEMDAGAAYCRALQDRLEERASHFLSAGQKQWDETEQRRISAFVGRALGKRPVYVNECAGLHYPFLPADEFFDRRHFPWLEELEAQTDVIRSELEAILRDPGEEIRPYVRMEEGAPQNKWTQLDHSLDWGACFFWEHGEPNLPVHDRCPKTAALLDRLPLLRIPRRGPAAFFSILRPHSHIPAHTGVTNTRAIVHLPLIVPAGCGFRVGGEVREWVEGSAFAFDDTIEHEAWNRSDELRAVLILDAWNPHLSEREREAVSAYIQQSDQALS